MKNEKHKKNIKMKNIQTFEQFISESNNIGLDTKIILEEIESIISELELENLINSLDESNSEEKDPFENLTLEELEDLCEEAWIKEFSSVFEDDEDDEDIAMAKKDAKVSNTIDTVHSNVGTLAASIIGTLAFGPWGTLFGLAVPLQNIIKEKIALRKALKIKGDKLPEAKREALKQKLKKLTKNELEIYAQRAEARGKIAGINAAKNGKTTPPKDASPEKKKGFEAGVKLAASAKEKAKKIKEMPKDKMQAVIKKVEDKKKEIDNIKQKDKDTMAKIEGIKQKSKK